MNQRQRKQKIQSIYDQSKKLTLHHRWYRRQVYRYILEIIKEDSSKDITTKKFVSRRHTSQAVITAHEPGIITGLTEIAYVAKKLGITVTLHIKDGARVKTNKIICTLEGNTRTIFKLERTLLNTIQRLSGIATTTDRLRTHLQSQTIICATRKTLWNGLDKHAVAVGGGYTHRLGLFDAVMIKDNHLQLLPKIENLKFIVFNNRVPRILEVSSFKQLQQIIKLEPRVDVIMFDNFTPVQIKRALTWAKRQRIWNNYLFEASGGITQENIEQYAKTGVDAVSLGSLTHSAQALNISMDIT